LKLSKTKSKHLEKYEKLQKDHISLTDTYDKKLEDLTISKSENLQYKITIATQAAGQLAMENENKTLKISINESENTLKYNESEIKNLNEKIAQLELRISQMDIKLIAEEKVRRQLHNEIQELKGNIRVFCRIRPPIEKESEEGALSHMTFSETDEGSIELSQYLENATNKTISKSYPFSFDKVIWIKRRCSSQK
jgi:kinesin family protein C1